MQHNEKVQNNNKKADMLPDLLYEKLGTIIAPSPSIKCY